MRAMILAAGRGERMRPLTDNLPKPLLFAGKKRLIEYHLDNLVASGFKNIVINHAYLGHKIEKVLGNGSKYNVNIIYSAENNHGLETGGGIYNALPLLSKIFLVINGDIWCNYDFQSLLNVSLNDNLAHLIMVNNPSHNPKGDFYLTENQQISLDSYQAPKLTFSGIGIYKAELFKNCKIERFRLASLLKIAIKSNLVSGEHFSGKWLDIGTPERLFTIQS
jgi:MurNAc alpha-1-phosphate uridylyltransferase